MLILPQNSEEITRTISEVAIASKDSLTQATNVQKEAHNLASSAEQLRQLVKEFKKVYIKIEFKLVTAINEYELKSH